VCDVIYLG